MKLQIFVLTVKILMIYEYLMGSNDTKMLWEILKLKTWKYFKQLSVLKKSLFSLLVSNDFLSILVQCLEIVDI